MEIKTLIFEVAGEHNTDATLQISLERALALGIPQVVVASSHGRTARKAQELFAPAGIKVIAVTSSHAWEDEGWTMSADIVAELEELGITVHTGAHALGNSIGSAFSGKYGGYAPEEIVRDTLYRFCQGMKVAVQITLAAASAALLDMAKEVIAIGGTAAGADTAIVCKPAHPRTFHELEIREVLAKPRVP